MPDHAAEVRSTHLEAGHDWAIVLAGGEGSRLRALTTTAAGVAIPKQFCSLGGGASLLHDALMRARVVAPPERTCIVVAAHHRQWWQELSRFIPMQNIIVQPRNCGTANGILLPLLRILHRDPDASLLVLPSDHYVRNETILAAALRQAAMEVASPCGGIVLLGFAPEEADPELGYILPAVGAGASPGVCGIEQFVEKPGSAAARELIARGALWNAFIFAARGKTLLRVFEERCPEIVMEMRGILGRPNGDTTLDRYLIELYERLPAMDFSRDVIQRCASQLRVLRVPTCGWSDLGTPRRLAETLSRGWAPRRPSAAETLQAGGFLDLARQHGINMAGGRGTHEMKTSAC
jgi:mannose-1-phosphate guanylyltransferase